jgi:N-acetylmuramoyl-L-alanine amidase
MRPTTLLAALALAALASAAWPQPEAASRELTAFNPRWQPVHPRTPEGVYPNLPTDWQPIPNPRVDLPADHPLAGLRICIDPGHGGQVWGPTHGYTGGTRGAVTGLTESDANLRTAFFLWDLLTRAGADVTMTRLDEDRVTPPAPEGQGAREELHARDAIAEAASCDYFVAIHHNAPANDADQTNYTAVYYFDTSQYNDQYNADPAYVHRYPDEELNRERYELAQAVQAALVRRLDLPAIPLQEGAANNFGHGVPHGDFHVIRETKLPAILAECSFMTNREEDLRLNDPGRAKQEALAIFEGLLDFFRTHPVRRWSERPAAGPSPGS